MSDASRLLANLGAEEDADGERMRSVPRVASAARLWRLLFAAGTPALVDADGDAPVALDDPGASAEDAFDWLVRPGHCTPWLADAAAWRAAETAGLPIHGAPGDVTRRVNDKAFAVRAAEAEGLVARPLRGTSVVLDPELLARPDAALARVREAIAVWPAFARRAFTLKPRLGTSGRGRVDGLGIPDALPREDLARLARAGGAVLEPWLDRARDLSAQLHVGNDAEIVLLGTLEQRTSAHGLPLGHRGEIDSKGRVVSGLPEDEALREAAAALARAAAREGYAGPCGVDALAFHWRDAADEPRTSLRPIVELNARFTMGIVALALARRFRPGVRKRLGLRAGERRAFEVRLDAPRDGWTAVSARGGDDAFTVPLHRDGDAVRPGIVYARTREDLDRALGEAGDAP